MARAVALSPKPPLPALRERGGNEDGHKVLCPYGACGRGGKRRAKA
jgi:hypothetical protein